MSAADMKVRGAVAWLTPRGAGDLERARALRDAAEEIRFAEDVAVVVLAARRDGFFFSAVDPGSEVVAAVAEVAALAPPVIGILPGPASGAGAALALACDLRLGSPRCFFQFPQLAVGHLPAGGITQRLPRIVGRMRALDLLLTGRRLGSAEALRIGVLSEVARDLNTVARRRAADLARKGPIALRYAKEAVCAGMDLTLAQGIRLEQDLYVLLQTTADRAEGVQAFKRRRAPRYRGR